MDSENVTFHLVDEQKQSIMAEIGELPGCLSFEVMRWI